MKKILLEKRRRKSYMRFMSRNSSSTYARGNLDGPDVLYSQPSGSKFEVFQSKLDPTKFKSPRTSHLSPINSTGIERNLNDSGAFLDSIRFHDSSN